MAGERPDIKEYLRKLSLLNRDVRLYLLASATIGFTILNGIYPVLFNLYLLRLGHGPEFVGLVNAIGLFSYALSAFPAGVVASRLGIRRTMTVGVLVSLVCHALQPLAEFVPLSAQNSWLLVNRSLATSGLALYFVNAPPFLANATSPDERAHAYSLRMVVSTLAGFLGSLVGGVLPGLLAPYLGATTAGPAPYRYALLIAAALCAFAVWALASMREADGTGTGTHDETAPAGAVPISLIATMAFVVLLHTSSVGTTRAFLNVYLDDGLGVSTAQIGALFAAIQLAAVPAALAIPLLTGRWGSYRVIIGASLGMGASMLPLALIPHWGAATLGRMGVYVLSAIADPVLSVYQMELVSPRWRPIMAGAVSTALGLSWAALALGGGYLITGLGYRPLFLTAGALTTGGTLLFWFLFRQRARS